MPINLQESRQTPKRLSMTSEVQKDMMRHASLDEPIKACRNWFSLHFNKEAVARNPSSRWNRPAFEGGHVVAIVASPKA
jgi:hypothetical protein